MEVFRIIKEKYASQLSASGVENRWNKTGEFVIYTGASRSLSTLELIVHRNAVVPEIDYRVMVISLPDDDKFYTQLLIKNLPGNWRSMSAYAKLQQTGSQWYLQQSSLILKVPSVIIPNEYNYIINTKHPDYNQVKLVRIEKYFWDDRLL